MSVCVLTVEEGRKPPTGCRQGCDIYLRADERGGREGVTRGNERSQRPYFCVGKSQLRNKILTLANKFKHDNPTAEALCARTKVGSLESVGEQGRWHLQALACADVA